MLFTINIDSELINSFFKRELENILCENKRKSKVSNLFYRMEEKDKGFVISTITKLSVISLHILLFIKFN